ncbi:hypothetical protein ACFQY7_38570 [Actinomadura luteofluorescens]|uniref:hypothetical protein n=1 Tax=Actinomadura luteofluorescens TaxID=46163 RepID=UPI003639CBFA
MAHPLASGSPGCGLRDLLGLPSGLERKNGWTLAEFAGDALPPRWPSGSATWATWAPSGSAPPTGPGGRRHRV